MKLKRAEQGSWQTETIWHKNPEDCNEVLAKILFWTRFIRYNIVVAILDAWKSRKVFTTRSVEVSYRGCLKHRSHYLKPSWAVMPMSTCLKSNQTADVSQDFSQWVSRVWLGMTQKLLSRFWSWVMTWLWHELCFCLIMWCSLALILLDFFILKFHEAFKSHLPAVTMLSLIDGSSQSCHSTTKLMNLCKLNIQTWTAHRSQMRTLSWLNIFEPILDRIIPKSVRKKEKRKEPAGSSRRDVGASWTQASLESPKVWTTFLLRWKMARSSNYICSSTGAAGDCNCLQIRRP